MGIFSSLKQYGIKDLEDVDLFAAEKKEVEIIEEKLEELQKSGIDAEKSRFDEKSFLLEKTCNCPVCQKTFKEKTVKSGKTRFIGTDIDLRPKYDTMDPLKYDVILCPHCGYAALMRYFSTIAPTQAKLILENISAEFKMQMEEKAIYTYEDAIERYKLALVNAVVKRGKASEKAYTCLKTAWVIKGSLEEFSEKKLDNRTLVEERKADMAELYQNALEGFLAARQTESFPICGMDEQTLDYLVAYLSLEYGELNVAVRLVSSILTSRTAGPRIKDKTRELKELVLRRSKLEKELGI